MNWRTVGDLLKETLNYSAQILLFGAELTHVYTKRYGSRIVPTANAVLLTLEGRVHQGIPPTKYVEAVGQAQEAKPGSDSTQIEHQAIDTLSSKETEILKSFPTIDSKYPGFRPFALMSGSCPESVCHEWRNHV